MKEILDQLSDFLDAFKEVNSIDPSILEETLPFALNEKNRAKHTSGYHLETKNEQFLSLIESVRVENEEIIGVNDDINSGEASLLETLKQTVLKLNRSGVFCIKRMNDESDENHNRIFIGSKKECECNKCKFNNLNLYNLVLDLKNTLPSELSETNSNNKNIETAFALFRVGKYEESFFFLKKIETKAKENKEFITYFLTKYNQKRLKPFINHLFTPEEISYNVKENILSEINNIDLIKEIELLNIGPIQRRFIVGLRDKKLILDTRRKLDESTERIKKYYNGYQREGFWSSGDNSLHNLQESFVILSQFLNNNSLFDIGYYYYSEICITVFEGLVASYMTSDRYEYKYKSFHFYFLKEFILNTRPRRLEEILVKYGVNYIMLESGDSSLKKLIGLSDGFFKSFFVVSNFLSRNVSSRDLVASLYSTNRFFETKIKAIANNIIMLISYIDLAIGKKEEIKSITENLLDFLSLTPNLKIIEEHILGKFLRRKISLFPENRIDDLINICTSDHIWSDRVYNGLCFGINEYFPDYRITNEVTLQKILNRTSERNKYRIDVSTILPFFDLLGEKNRRIFIDFFESFFNNSDAEDLIIDWELLFKLIQKGVIRYNYKDLLYRYVLEKMNIFENVEVKDIDGDYYINNGSVFSFIFIFYSRGLDLKYVKPIIDNDKTPLFLKWVFAPEDECFDYTKNEFDPKWLLIFDENSGTILSRISKLKVDSMKDKVHLFLQSSFDSKLAEIYFRYFAKGVKNA